MPLTVRPATVADVEAIATLYNPYISNTVVTFEEEPVTGAEIARRMEAVFAAGLPWLVAVEQTEIAGYAYASPWRIRSAYRYSTEVTVYTASGFARRGIGSALYARLLDDLREQGIHCAFGGIALPNDASVALHEKFGFKKVAHLEQVGFKFGRWIDLGYWQLVL